MQVDMMLQIGNKGKTDARVEENQIKHWAMIGYLDRVCRMEEEKRWTRYKNRRKNNQVQYMEMTKAGGYMPVENQTILHLNPRMQKKQARYASKRPE